MSAQEVTLSIHLDERARRRLEKAAGLMHESSDVFLGRVGDEVARRVLLDWAVAEYRRGERTFGELAEETGLWIEEIMAAMADQGPDDAAGPGPAGDVTTVGSPADPALYQAVEQVITKLRERLRYS
jgi:hypothetical protein